MIKKELIITNKTGLHMRPAHHVVQEAKKYTCDIRLIKKNDKKSANLKSLVSLLKISVSQNTEVEIICEGEDEKNAATALEKVISSLVD